MGERGFYSPSEQFMTSPFGHLGKWGVICCIFCCIICGCRDGGGRSCRNDPSCSGLKRLDLWLQEMGPTWMSMWLCGWGILEPSHASNVSALFFLSR